MKASHLKGMSLGILTAIGGFIDMGGIITTTQAGAEHRYALLWTLVLGIVGLVIYVDMAGRVVIASGRTLFDVIRDRLGFRLAMVTLVATMIVNVLTLLVEIAGMSLVLEIVSRLSYLLWVPVIGVLLAIVLWRESFDVLENGSAALGLAMLVSVVALFKLDPNWGEIGKAVVHPPASTMGSMPVYLFAAFGLLGGYMTPYQFFFYSSGALEEEWTGEDLVINRATSIVGSIFGGIVAFALIVISAVVLFPKGMQVQTLRDAGQPIRASLGLDGFGVFLFGAFAVSLGAGIESALSGAYAVCQYFGWDWGKHGKPRQAPLFVLTYLAMIAAAIVIALTGVDPIRITVVSLAAAAASLPFTFGPLLIVANDKDFVGDQANTPAVNAAAIVILVLLIMVTIGVIPLLILTGGGS
jgi:Mn2+/Fe2+ NRAMP family transporter